MKQAAKSKARRIKPTAQQSKNAIILKAIEELYSRGEKYPTLPSHTQPGPKDPFAYVLAHPGTTRAFASLCKKYGYDFRHEVNKALKVHMPKMVKRPDKRKKYRQKREQDEDRAIAFLGDHYDEIMEADRSKIRTAEFRREDSRIPAKPINDAAFLSDLGILDDGLEPI